MAVKQTGRKVYKSMNGRTVDMDLLRQKNELTPAVGNARVNARGDELGPGGKIIKKREDVLADFYRDHPNTVEDESPVVKTQAQPVIEQDDWVEPTPVKKASTKTQKESVQDEEWIEDENGDFVKKGE
jgi:hypothetical protein